ncbi:MAG: NUDIX hydrolase [Proteobacteria bacterium]|nr:NUDIX hydrolase [Pseudomonadota bacterium]
MIRPWREIQSRIEYQTRIFTLKIRRMLSPRNGLEHDFYVLETADWVNVIPLTADNRVVMVRQYRAAADEITLEIPGGLIESGQTPEESARRELLEETGHACEELVSLGRVRPNPAILENTCHFFLARGAEQVAELNQDEAEDIEVVKVGLDEIPGMIAEGRIDHSLVVAAFYRFFSREGRSAG